MNHSHWNHLPLIAGLAALCPLTCALAQTKPTAAPEKPTPPGEAVENKVSPASETSVNPPPPKPAVKKLADGKYQIGLITLDKNTRQISFPAKANIVEEDSLLEYLLVHTQGEKVHESLLITDADPTHINIALKLLRYKESKELFRELKEDGTPGKTYPEVPEATRQAARFSVHVTHQKNGKDKTTLVSDWIQHAVTKKPMVKTAWVYNGSYIHNKQFKAKINGNILTIQPDESGIANYSGDDREQDAPWRPAARTPQAGTRLTVTLKPWKE